MRAASGRPMWHYRETLLMAAGARQQRAESARAVVAEEVVPGQDVVDLKAFRAGVALAHIALEHRVVADDARSLAVAQHALSGRAAAGLAGGRRGMHQFFFQSPGQDPDILPDTPPVQG